MESDVDDQGEWISIGGPIDRSRISLCLYGRDLDPDALTAALSTEPSQSHRAGDKVTPRHDNVYKDGVWVFDLDGQPASPGDPEATLEALLSQVPMEREFWSNLNVEEVRIKVMLVMEDWNRGFSLSPNLLRRLADFTDNDLDFSIWFEPPGPEVQVHSA